MATRVVLAPGWEAKIDVFRDRIANNVAGAIADDMRRYAPVDTGALVAGIDTTEAEAGHALVTVDRDVSGDDPDVPLYVEYGTENMDAQPFMRPAAYQKRSL